MKTQTKIAKQVIAAKKMIAAVDAAEKAGLPMTPANMKKLGYVKTEGGVWELPIPVHVCKILADEEKRQKFAAVDAAEKAAKKRGTPLTDEELKSLGYIHIGGGNWDFPLNFKKNVRR